MINLEQQEAITEFLEYLEIAEAKLVDESVSVISLASDLSRMSELLMRCHACGLLTLGEIKERLE